MKIFLRYWLPVFIWVSVIFIGSTDLMSAEHTSRFIAPFLHWLRPDISAEAIAQVQFFVRKTAHVSEYAILAILLLRALRAGRERVIGRTLILTLLLAAGHAALDEFHQSFVASRTASPYDVMIDTCGAVLGLALFWLLSKGTRLESA
ncbi:MAG: VanZ family protein [Chthoniobacterales bacterium]